MSEAWAQIYGDDVAATHTVASSGFERFPGSTVWTGESGGNDFLSADPNNVLGPCFISGKDGKGIYKIEYNASFTGDAGNQLYHIACFRNATKLPMASLERKLGTAGDIGAASAGGFVVINAATDIIDIRVQTASTGTQITINHLCINMHRISTSTAVG